MGNSTPSNCWPIGVRFADDATRFLSLLAHVLTQSIMRFIGLP